MGIFSQTSTVYRFTIPYVCCLSIILILCLSEVIIAVCAVSAVSFTSSDYISMFLKAIMFSVIICIMHSSLIITENVFSVTNVYGRLFPIRGSEIITTATVIFWLFILHKLLSYAENNDLLQ